MLGRSQAFLLQGISMIEFTERRKFKRFPIYCPLVYKAEGNLPRERSISINMSEGGAMMSSNRCLALGANLIVRLLLAKREFFLRSRIVHIQQQSTSDPYYMGIEFLDKRADFILKFYEEIEGIMHYRKLLSEENGREATLAEASMKWYRNSPAWID